MTFNPCWGCLNHCEYCYARRIAKRFWKQRYMEECNYQFKLHPDWVWTGDHLSGLKDFKPTWLESKYAKKFPRKPQRIFVGSMSEIAHWREEWVEKVIEKVKLYPSISFASFIWETLLFLPDKFLLNYLLDKWGYRYPGSNQLCFRSILFWG